MLDQLDGIAANAGYGPQLDALKEQALIYSATARERFALGRDKVSEYIVKEPVRAAGIALGVGVLLGWLIKRR
jgi:ElaB/YqjD/DUF883 family membrane-anchored ribosome-binding protein